MIESKYTIFDALCTVRDFIRWGTSRFVEAKIYLGHGTDNAWDEAVRLVLHALHLPLDMDKNVFAEVLGSQLTKQERLEVYTILEIRIKTRIPTPYLTGEAWFAGLPFKVDERVLIPRSPIAELVESGFEPWLKMSPSRILDLCTGSGCIGIACALAFPDALVDISDLSPDALDVAEVNVARYQLEDQVQIIHSDLFANVDEENYDLIISNPPYVDARDFAEMPEEFRHEPSLGLDAGTDGLDIVRYILRDAAKHLHPGGILIVEVGNSGAALEETYPEVPFLWFEFERGGHGVFMLTASQLAEHQQCFSAACPTNCDA